MYYTYIFQLKDESFYHGFSENLKQRFKEHEQVRLIFYAAFLSKDKALKFEKYLKTGSGFAFRNKHLL